MQYPTIEDAIGKTPLVALQRIDAAANAKRGNVILGKLEGNNPAGSVKDHRVSELHFSLHGIAAERHPVRRAGIAAE